MTEQEKEKVLHGIDSCGFCDGVPNICEVTECPYRGNKGWCVHELAYDAGMLISELMKENEAVKPKFVQDVNGAYSVCGKCNHKLWKLFTVAPSKMPRFCSQCGRKVKWE